MKILIINSLHPQTFETFFTQEVKKELAEIGSVEYFSYDEREECRAQLLHKLADADIVFTGWGAPKFDSALLEHAKILKIIAHTGGSAFNLLSETLVARTDITLLCGNQIYAQSVAEAAICFMIMGQRRINKIRRAIEQNGWKPSSYTRTDGIRHKTVGLVGFGMVAKYVALMLQPFGASVKVWAEYEIPQLEIEKYQIDTCSLDELCETCDVVSLHAGMSEANYHIINKDNLRLMKDGSLLVNTSRGSLINQEDLEEELVSGRLRAVLDVFEQEPLPLTSRLRGLENVILLPHTGGPTEDMRMHTTLALIADIKKYIKGETDLFTKLDFAYASRMTNHNIQAANNATLTK